MKPGHDFVAQDLLAAVPPMADDGFRWLSCVGIPLTVVTCHSNGTEANTSSLPGDASA